MARLSRSDSRDAIVAAKEEVPLGACRFGEDGLRPLRAVRFASTLRLALDRPTQLAIPQALDVFARVAMERVRDELIKLLVRAHRLKEKLRGSPRSWENAPEVSVEALYFLARGPRRR